MRIDWASLLVVFVVSLGSTVAVVALVTLAMLGLSARAAGPHVPTRPPLFSRSTGTVVGGCCLTAAALILLLGLWEIVAR